VNTSVKDNKFRFAFTAAFFLSIPLTLSLFAFGVQPAVQNSNSSTTQESGSMMSSKPKTTHKTKHKAAKPKTDDAAAATDTGANSAGASEDLSGTYTGTVNYPDGSLSGPATLMITGNDFTLTPDGGTAISGHVSAVKTRGYTGVAMQLGAYSPSGTGQGTPPVSVSLRMKKKGNGLWLTSVPEAAHQFSFMTGGKK
jgi:hypothetical protein